MTPPALIAAALIAVDWGTTSMRAVLLSSDGSPIAEAPAGPGILAVPPAGFESVLAGMVAAWRAARGALPIVLSGMIGSRQGWVEVPYLPAPAAMSALAAGLHRHDSESLGPVHLVPGLSLGTSGQPPDVMRGEETQIAGALDAAGTDAGLFVLPGTHSKWVAVAGNSITHFATYMTGEIYAALRHHTILGRLMPGEPDADDASAFRAGVSAGAADGPPGALLNRLFATRTLGLFDRLPKTALPSYLSGLLIGAELAAATSISLQSRRLTIVGSAPPLTQRYLAAAHVLGLEAHAAPAGCAARGAFVLARAANLLDNSLLHKSAT